MDLNGNADLRELARLDPAREREASQEEWIRARVAVDRIVAFDDISAVPVWRRSRRRWFALAGTAAAAVAAGVVAVPALLPGTAENAFGAWTAEPAELDDGQVQALVGKCAGFVRGADTAAELVMGERRGVATLLLLRRRGAIEQCVSLDSREVSNWQAVGPDPHSGPGDGRATIETMAMQGADDTQYSSAVGRVGSSVTAIDLVMPDGEVVHTSVSSGWWAAWWPGPEGGERTFKVVVHTAKGEATFVPEQLIPRR